MVLVFLSRNLDRVVETIAPLIKDDGNASDANYYKADLFQLVHALTRGHHERNQHDSMEVAETVYMGLHRYSRAPYHDC